MEGAEGSGQPCGRSPQLARRRGGAARHRERATERTGGGGLGCVHLAGRSTFPPGRLEDLRIPGVPATRKALPKRRGVISPRRGTALGPPKSPKSEHWKDRTTSKELEGASGRRSRRSTRTQKHAAP